MATTSQHERTLISECEPLRLSSRVVTRDTFLIFGNICDNLFASLVTLIEHSFMVKIKAAQ